MSIIRSIGETAGDWSGGGPTEPLGTARSPTRPALPGFDLPTHLETFSLLLADLVARPADLVHLDQHGHALALRIAIELWLVGPAHDPLAELAVSEQLSGAPEAP